MTYLVTEEWLDDNNVDVGEFLAALESAGYEDSYDWERGGWYLTDCTDADGNNIPDILDELIGSPVVTNPSQGGIGG